MANNQKVFCILTLLITNSPIFCMYPYGRPEHASSASSTCLSSAPSAPPAAPASAGYVPSLRRLAATAIARQILFLQKSVWARDNRVETACKIRLDLLNQPEDIQNAVGIIGTYLVHLENKNKRHERNLEACKASIRCGQEPFLIEFLDRLFDKRLKKELLYFVIQENYLNALRILIKSCSDLPINDDYFDGRSCIYSTPLAKAVKCKNLDAIKMLLSAGANINSYNDNRYTALYLAVDLNLIEMVQYLISAGADVNQICYMGHFKIEGTTPLCRASVGNRLDLVKMLVKNGADLEKYTDQGETPLYAAASQGHIEEVTYLLDAGAHINNGGYHSTPLYTASCFGCTDVVRLLLQRGADLNIEAIHSGTPLDIAREHKHTEVIKLLEEAPKGLKPQ